MKITDIETVRLCAPVSSGGRLRSRTGVRARRYTTLVEVHTDAGVAGVGSCSGNGALVEAVVAKVLKPLLVGLDPCAVEEVWDRAYFRGGAGAFGSRGVGVVALSGVDTALWDIRGKVEKAPVYELLGGAFRERVPVYATALYPDHPGRVRERAHEFASQGFKAMKIKVGFDLAKDIEMVEFIRAELGDSYALMTDANMGYELEVALKAADAFRARGIRWLEEPFFVESVEDHARFRAVSSMPVALGENLHTRFAFEGFVSRKAVDVLQPDVARAGGVSEVKQIAALAQKHRLPISLHTWGDAVALAASLHLATALENSEIMELDCTENPLRTHLLQNPLTPADGFMKAPEGPGLGIDLDTKAITRYRFTGDQEVSLRPLPLG